MKMTMWLSFAFACNSSQPTPPPARFDAVPATPEKVSLDSWCDQYPSADTAKPFDWPGTDTPPPSTGKPTWVNIWATWCGPCVAEMPRLASWQDKLRQDGIESNLVFISVDEKTSDVERFYKQHPSFPPSLHMTDPKTLEPWLNSVGLDASAAIPLQFFLDGQGRMRCERSGGVGDGDYAEVKTALQKG